MKLLLTGATGFVGRAIVDLLLAQGHSVITLVRKYSDELPTSVKQIVVGDLSLPRKSDTSMEYLDLIGWLSGVDVVIYSAARVHIMNDTAVNPLDEFRNVNTLATLRLAKLAAEAGVRRFVFISSIKVNGEVTNDGCPFTSEDKFVPNDPYGLSKYEAEQGLLTLAKETGMEVVIIRPPLVYGPNVKANFRSMMKWVNKGIPLPFGAVHNQRSLVALDNLVSFITYCIDHPKAANEIFLISDGEDISTTTLLKKVAKAFGKKSRLLPIPVWLMRLLAKMVGKADVANRLFGSLQVDSSKARDLLGWKPVITMDEELKKTAEAYLNETNL